MVRIINWIIIGLVVVGVVIYSILRRDYLNECFDELKKVSWPSREVAWNSAIVTIIFIVVFSLFLAVIDYLLNLAFIKLVG
jgi:preprotein translocase SecE subunit